MGTIISASDLTVSQIQNGIVIVDQDTKDYANNTIEWQVLGKDQDGNGTITIQTKTCVGDGAEGYGTAVGDRRYDPSRNKLDSELQVWLDTDFYNHIGSNLKAAIIPTTKAITPYQSGDISSRECKLFSLSVAEVGGYDLSGSAPEDYTPESGAFTYQYFQGIESTDGSTKRVRTGGTYGSWWLRSPDIHHPSEGWALSNTGSVHSNYTVSVTTACPSPACVLPSTIQLEEVETGKYNIVWSGGGGGNEKTLHVLGCGKTQMDQQTHFVLNPTTEDWDEKTLPYDHMDNGTNAIVYDNEIHVFGGFYESNRLKHYKWLGDSWEEVSTLPYPCDYTSAVVYNGELHILGGRHSGAIYKHYKWNGVSWSEVSTLPDSFSGINFAVVYNNEIHILSGDTANKHFKWNGTQWTEVSTLPYNPKDNVDDTQTGIVVYDGKIHILGGRAQEVQRYHYAWDGTSWSSVSTLPSDIGNEPAAVVFDNKIHIFNNGLSSGETESKHYSWDGTSWSNEDDVPWGGSTGAKILVYEYGYAGKGEKKYLDKNGTQHLIDKIKADKEDKFRFSTMPVADATWLGKTVEYTGTTTQTYTHSKRYECQVVPESSPTAYEWVEEAGANKDDRIDDGITKIGVRFDDGYRPYIMVNLASIIPAFSTLNLDDLKDIVEAYYAGDITLANIQEVWSVGNSNNMAITATSSTAAQTVALKIIDFNRDTLVTSVGETTKALLTLGFEVAENGTMGGDASTGWSGCSLRTWCNGALKDSIPDVLKEIIKPISRTVPNGGTSATTNTIVQDSVFIPTINEFIGRTTTKAEVNNSSFFYWYPGSAGTRYAGHAVANIRSKQMLTASSAYNTSSEPGKPLWWQLANANNSGSASTGNPSSGIMPHFCI